MIWISLNRTVYYCRIGERSSHTWFVLHELLGYPKVRNYDGSWTEWGSLIGAPIERVILARRGRRGCATSVGAWRRHAPVTDYVRPRK